MSVSTSALDSSSWANLAMVRTVVWSIGMQSLSIRVIGSDCRTRSHDTPEYAGSRVRSEDCGDDEPIAVCGVAALEGGMAELVLAWWDPNESGEGWSDAGHLTNAYDGWITVNLN